MFHGKNFLSKIFVKLNQEKIFMNVIELMDRPRMLQQLQTIME